MNLKMNLVKETLAAAAAAMLLAGCATTQSDAVLSQDAQAAAALFENNGWTMMDINTAADKTDLKMVSENGGANVEILPAKNDAEAQTLYGTVESELTQSDYYMNQELPLAHGTVAVFTNSMNYDNAVAILDEKDHTVIVVRELNQESLSNVLAVLLQSQLAL